MVMLMSEDTYDRLVARVFANLIPGMVSTASSYWALWAWVAVMFAWHYLYDPISLWFLFGIFITSYMWTVAVTFKEYDLIQPVWGDSP